MNRLTLFDDALSACQRLKRSYPSDQAIQSVITQLEYLIDLENRRRTDWERLDDVIIGVLTTREIEQLSESCANLLYDVHGEVDKMKWEWRKLQA